MATEKYKALMSEYRQLAKRADQRLVRLEKRANSGQEWKAVTKYAYANAMEEIRRFSGAEAKRFNVKPPNTTQMLQAKINAMKRFLESPTSTTTGIRRTYEKRVNTINKEYGTDFTWEELKEFFEAYKAGDKVQAEKELGDLLFAAVNIGRKAGADCEKALKESTDRFAARFTKAEQLALADGKVVTELSEKEWDKYYLQAKKSL